jgi:hypothetical protein
MKIRGNLIRVLFGLNLLIFVFSMLSPWVWKQSPLIFERRPWPFNSGEELYWSFQGVLYPYRSGYQNRLISWDFWFGPHERVVLWDFWFSREMYYYGFSYEWIRIFVSQCLTIFSTVLVMSRKWHKTKWMLAPASFSMLSAFLGLLLVARFMFVWSGYSHPAWGLPVAIVSAAVFVTLFLLRFSLERRKHQRNEDVRKHSA